MKGVLTYVLPKLIKTVGGVVVGVAVFTAFKHVYETYFPVMQTALDSFAPVVNKASGAPVLQYGFTSMPWFHVLNYCLPVVETINVFAIFVPTVVSVYLVKFVFSILDKWINGVSSLVKGG